MAGEQKITVYVTGGFGVNTYQGRLDKLVDQVTKPGQKLLYYYPKGKRKVSCTAGGSTKPFLLVLKGHDHPNAPNWLVTQADGSKKSRYASYDPRFETDFNKLINPHLATLETTDIVLDQRHTKAEECDVND